MKTLKFRGFKTQWILNGTKISSMRLFDEKNIQAGDDLELINWDTGKKFAEAKVTEVREKKLEQIEEADFEGHEKFESKEEMLKTYRKYYGDKVTMDTAVKIIHFKLLRTRKEI